MNLLAQLVPAQPNDWWWVALTSGPALWLLGFAVLCVVLLMYFGLRLRAMSAGVRRASVRERLADDSGVAMIEFVLVTPILLIVTLLLIQTMLVFTGLFYVQYSAFAAARTAIVQIPSELGLPSNEIGSSSAKADKILGSAVVALVPVSGRESSTNSAGAAIGPLFVGAMSQMYSTQGKSEPNWVNEMLAERINYAANHTDIELHRVYPGEGSQTVVLEPIEGYTLLGPKDAISVTVRHEFALSVPLASRVFSAVGESGSYSPASRDGESPGPPGQWTMIESRAILTNEGIDRRLPQAPEVPRR